jgi:hypothetical protein
METKENQQYSLIGRFPESVKVFQNSLEGTNRTEEKQSENEELHLNKLSLLKQKIENTPKLKLLFKNQQRVFSPLRSLNEERCKRQASSSNSPLSKYPKFSFGINFNNEQVNSNDVTNNPSKNDSLCKNVSIHSIDQTSSFSKLMEVENQWKTIKRNLITRNSSSSPIREAHKLQEDNLCEKKENYMNLNNMENNSKREAMDARNDRNYRKERKSGSFHAFNQKHLTHSQTQGFQINLSNLSSSNNSMVNQGKNKMINLEMHTIPESGPMCRSKINSFSKNSEKTNSERNQANLLKYNSTNPTQVLTMPGTSSGKAITIVSPMNNDVFLSQATELRNLLLHDNSLSENNSELMNNQNKMQSSTNFCKSSHSTLENTHPSQIHNTSQSSDRQSKKSEYRQFINNLNSISSNIKKNNFMPDPDKRNKSESRNSSRRIQNKPQNQPIVSLFPSEKEKIEKNEKHSNTRLKKLA